VNAPAVTPTKVQNDKIVRALKKLSVTDPDETLIIKIVSAFVALGVNPQAKSSSWLARRLKSPAGFRVRRSASSGGGSRTSNRATGTDG
jgi:hypothetical protein